MGDYQIDPNFPTLFGDTPLILAVRYRKKDAMHALLKLRATRVNEQDGRGRSALVWAVLNRDIECIQTLLDHRATVHKPAANCKKTAIMFAASLDEDEPISGVAEFPAASVMDILRLLLRQITKRREDSAKWTKKQRQVLKECMVRRDEFGWCALHF